MTLVAHSRRPGGRRGAFKRYTIGPMDVLKLDDARTEAKRILALARLGKDPAAEKSAKRGEITVSELCKLYLEEATATKKSSTGDRRGPDRASHQATARKPCQQHGT